MALEKTLNETIAKNPEKYREEIVERVRKFVKYQEEHPTFIKPYRFLESIDDFVLYYALHPEWHGLSTIQIQKHTENGGRAFYAALLNYAKIVSNQNKEKQKEIMQNVFKPKHNNWSSFTKLEDWQDYYNQHPEWIGKSTKKEGLKAFYQAFRHKYVSKHAKTEQERKELFMAVFKPKKNDWTYFTTIKQWQDYYNQHPEWIGKSVNDKESGLQAFYGYFVKYYITKHTKTEQEKKDLIKKVFKQRHNDWSSFTTIKQWQDYFNQHPEWHGLPTKDKKSGLHAFYAIFIRNYVNKRAKTKQERNAYLRAVFPENKAQHKYDFGNGEICFDSNSERIAGYLLHRYGLIEEFKEGENLHVRTNGTSLHSIDFLVDKTFIEYHPVGIDDRKNGRNIEQSGERKRKNIKNPKYAEFDFKHIWKINQLYDILQDEKIKAKLPEEYRNLTREQFKEHVNEAYRKSAEYDSKQPKLERAA